MMEYHRQRVGNHPPTRKKRVFLPDEQEVASPHRAGHSVGLHPEDTPFPTTADGMPFRHAPQIQTDEEEEAYEDETAFPRRASIVPRYNRIPTADGYIERRGNRDLQVHYVDAPPMPARSSRGRTTEASAHQEQRSPRRSRRFHWLFFVGIVLLVMLVGYAGLSAFGSWWHIHQDDSTYGRPRTFQVDAVVGHNDLPQHPSHFIAINLNRRVLVIEFPGGDASKTIIYTGPTLLGDGQDLTPVTLTFQDMNGDGRVDMVVHILDQTFVYLNNGSKFVPPSNSVVERGSNPPHLGAEQ